MYVLETERHKSPAWRGDLLSPGVGSTTRSSSTAPKRTTPTKFKVHQRVKSTVGQPKKIPMIVNKHEILSNNPANYKQYCQTVRCITIQKRRVL